MGFYAGTCGITKTAIFEHDEVVVIVLNKNEWLPFDLLKYQVSQQNYGVSYYDPIHSVLIGKYNDSGWIQNNNLPKEDDKFRQNCLIFHKWAVEFIIGSSFDTIKEPVGFVDNLFDRLYTLRNSPLDTRSIGIQHDGIREMKAQIGLYSKINEWLMLRIEEFEGKGYEDD